MTLNDYINSIAAAIGALPLGAIYNAEREQLVEVISEVYTKTGGEHEIVPVVLNTMPIDRLRELYIYAALIKMGVPEEVLPVAIKIVDDGENYKVMFVPPPYIETAIEKANALVAAGVLPELPPVETPKNLRSVSKVYLDGRREDMRSTSLPSLPAPKTFGTTHES